MTETVKEKIAREEHELNEKLNGLNERQIKLLLQSLNWKLY